MSSKIRRQRILEIIKEKEISKQDELVEILNEEGFNTTQATVSRDINELKLIKVKGESVKSKYAVETPTQTGLVSQDRVITLIKTFVVSVENAKNLVVVKTLAGNGSSCGMAIDRLKPEGVVGSIAGDDTLLIVTHDDESAEKVVEYIKKIIE